MDESPNSQPTTQFVVRADDRGTDRTILGVRFFGGKIKGAVDRLLRFGGLLVVPAAPALRTITTDAEYRRALLQADLVIPDSAYMVLLWNAFQKDDLPRVSGLAYMRELLCRPEAQDGEGIFWVMAGPTSAERNIALLKSRGIEVPIENIYIAPMYGRGEIHDEELLQQIEARRPHQIIVTLGGGTQERLGLYLQENLSYKPGIHCIGAAIAFLSGDQVAIPEWADQLYLGWLFRVLDEPKRYLPRYLAAFSLANLLWKYREKLPPMEV